jgi:hypothetical protein
VLAAFVGNYAIEVGKVPGYWLSIAILMALVFVSLAIIQRHVSRTSKAAHGASVAGTSVALSDVFVVAVFRARVGHELS